ncbi:MAG: endonuclease/exonuclease/phosphatase family protein [Candidatus Rokubacteria bacterium]|nr:endonuclease/exonuclease/phosphatase family protein [Candidatus Rokubacteria bacterium]
MRLVGWNLGRRRYRVLHGRLLRSLRPDVVALVDVGRAPTLAAPAAGWSSVYVPPAGRVGGVWLASRWPLTEVDRAPLGDDPRVAGRIAAARIRAPAIGAVRVVAVYVPTRARGRAVKDHFLRALLRRLPDWLDGPLIVTGDFNLCLDPIDEQRPFLLAWERARMRQLLDLGLVDAFRALHPGLRHYTWFSHRGNGWRIDHALVSRDLRPRLARCRIVDRARTSRASDHAAVLLTLR